MHRGRVFLCWGKSKASVRSLLFPEVQRQAVDAVPQAGGPWPVGEDVPEVPLAIAADDLDSPHSVAPVLYLFDLVPVEGVVKTGPSGTRIELGGVGKQFRAATGADVDTLRLVVQVLSREGRLGAFLPEHPVLIGAQLLLPLFIFHGLTRGWYNVTIIRSA